MTNIFIETKLYVIILSLLLLLSCQSRENRIRADIAAANKAYCPMKFGNFGSLNSIEFDDGRIIFSYELKEPDLISIISDNDNNKKLFDNYILKIASSSLKNIFSQGYDCVIKYSSPSISQIAVIELNSEEAKRITQEVISKKELAIEGARLSCLVWKRKVPMDLGDGIKITNVSFLNNTIINECEVEDEKKSDLSNLANIINIPD